MDGQGPTLHHPVGQIAQKQSANRVGRIPLFAVLEHLTLRPELLERGRQEIRRHPQLARQGSDPERPLGALENLKNPLPELGAAPRCLAGPSTPRALLPSLGGALRGGRRLSAPGTRPHGKRGKPRDFFERSAAQHIDDARDEVLREDRELSLEVRRPGHSPQYQAKRFSSQGKSRGPAGLMEVTLPLREGMVRLDDPAPSPLRSPRTRTFA